MTPLDLFLFLLLSGITGSGFTFVRFSKESFGAFVQATLRLVLGVAILGAIVVFKVAREGDFRAHLREMLTVRFTVQVFVVSFFNVFVAYSIYPIVEDSLNVGVVAVVIGTAPLFSVLFNRVLVKGSRISNFRLLGILVGFAGICVISADTIRCGIHGDPNRPKAKRNPMLDVAITVAAAASKALAAVLGARWFDKHHPLAVSFLQAWWGLLCCGAVALSMASERHNLLTGWRHATRTAWIGIVYLGAANSSAAFLLQFHLIHRIGAVRQKLVSFVGPIFALVEGIAIFKDWSHASALKISTQLVGTALVLLSIWMVNKKPAAAAPSSSSSSSSSFSASAAEQARTSLLINEEYASNATEIGTTAGEASRVRFVSFATFYDTDSLAGWMDHGKADPISKPDYLSSFDPAEFKRLQALDRAKEEGAKNMYTTI
jgi:drug/metabolite transporter (DMT)-like permease